MMKTDVFPLLQYKLNILHADDDPDDCLFFKEVLEELDFTTQLTTVHNGEQLMNLLAKSSKDSFDVLFLDLNMPRKNGFTCLEEIKLNPKLNSLPVIIFSTSYDQSVADLIYKNGAQHYISKPSNYTELKNIIVEALFIVSEKIASNRFNKNSLLKAK